MTFLEFKKIFQFKFQEFTNNQQHLYLTDVDKDQLWNTYLNSYPEHIRQEFNCNSCRSFIKNYGNLVTINSNYELSSYWDFEIAEPYATVVNALKQLVLSKPIVNVYLNETNKLGTDYNISDTGIKWNHLYYQLPNIFKTNKELIESKKSEYRDNKNVFKRSLEELSFTAVGTVLDLINDNTLYRGSEFKELLLNFEAHKASYVELSDKEKDNYCWCNSTKSSAITRIRNTSIGTLLIDLSNDVNIETAVRKYEKVVAPTNYKRPQAIITSRMVEDAQKTIESLGLTQALQRRFANSDDIVVNNVLWINRDNKQLDIFSTLKKEVLVNPKKLNNVKEVSLDTFVNTVLPTSYSVEVLVENKHETNLVSLLTSDNDSKLFKWDNNFSWCYKSNLTDSLKEKVKAAGGKVEGKLRISLEWYNYDDLDLGLIEPTIKGYSGNHIYYRNKVSRTGGNLDVDCNAGRGTTRTPVENIIYPYNAKMPDGEYQIYVNQYRQRETTDTGFKVEIEYNGEVLTFEHESPRQNNNTVITTFTVKDGLISFKENGKLNTKTIWNLKTNLFHKVDSIMYSPNYWNNNTGNKHLFLFVKDCKNTEPVRGIFNEHLKEELLIHKRVFEALGSKLVVPSSDQQLSGLGFSTTIPNDFIVKADNVVIKVVV